MLTLSNGVSVIVLGIPPHLLVGETKCVQTLLQGLAFLVCAL